MLMPTAFALYFISLQKLRGGYNATRGLISRDIAKKSAIFFLAPPTVLLAQKFGKIKSANSFAHTSNNFACSKLRQLSDTIYQQQENLFQLLLKLLAARAKILAVQA